MLSDVLAAVLPITGGLILLVYAALYGKDHCPDSFTGEHEWIHRRTPHGWCLQCARCARMTKGVSAFHRKSPHDL